MLRHRVGRAIAASRFVANLSPVSVPLQPRLPAGLASRACHHPCHVLLRSGHGGTGTGNSKPNRTKRGLYAGRGRQSGNNVSFSVRRTRRIWKPNVNSQSLFSELLGCKLQFKTTTSALRTIDKYGGLDNYLLRVTPHTHPLPWFRWDASLQTAI